MTAAARRYTEVVNLEALPGGEMVRKGIEDLAARRETAEALLVAIGADRLRGAGIALPDRVPEDPEHRLYALLASTEDDSAHSRYNAMIRTLVSFERAVECAR